MLSMPADGLYAGDPGVKLIAAFNAIAHPGRPLEIDLPRVGDQPVTYVERFFAVHGDHAHALQSPVFPLIAAPFIAAWGLRGAYLLPLASFVAMLPLLAIIRRRSNPETAVWLLVFIAVAANPVFFYALEFWEHVPATALLAAATALSIGQPTHSGSGLYRLMVAGVVAGLAIAMRPEALWYALVLFAMVVRSLQQAVATGLGLLISLGAFAVANYAHSGNPLGPHAAANLAPLGHEWGSMRLYLLQNWLAPSTLLAGSGLIVIGVAHASRPFGLRLVDRQVISLCGAAMITFAAASGHLRRETIWNAWPMFGLLLAPGVHRWRGLWPLALLPMAMVILTAPHDGGAQWGPRFLLIATPALVLLAAAAAQQLLRGDPAWRKTRTVLVCLILLGGAFVSRNAFRELRGAKRYYSQLVAAAEAQIPSGGYALTNVWWFDQITAPLYGRHTVLFAESERDYRAAVADIARAGVSDVTLVSSREDQTSAQYHQWIQNTCIRIVSKSSIPERLIEFERAACE